MRCRSCCNFQFAILFGNLIVKTRVLLVSDNNNTVIMMIIIIEKKKHLCPLILISVE